jgi:hypothetical protein
MNNTARGIVPKRFCWTRFGTEAGERVEAILARKEHERRAAGGVFFWGVGNSVGPGIAALLAEEGQPEVLFSPIRSRPQAADIAPDAIVRWLAAETLEGKRFDLPSDARVTSRGGRLAHYALVCESAQPLVARHLARLRFGSLRNLRTGNPVGPSQVTAVVRRVGTGHGADYVVALRARLVEPYFLRLVDPVAVNQRQAAGAG